MVEAYHNLACQWHGAEDAYLRLHARTHQLMQYFVRHKYRVSKDYNTYGHHPWHGAGQGAADAALRYIVLSDTLIEAYHSKITPQPLYDLTNHVQLLRSLKAFIDDVVLHTHQLSDEPLPLLQHQAQMKLEWWDQLVKVTGGELTPRNVVASCTHGPRTNEDSCNCNNLIFHHRSSPSCSKMSHNR